MTLPSSVFPGISFSQGPDYTRGQTLRRQPLQGFRLPVLHRLFHKKRFVADKEFVDKKIFLYANSIIHTLLSGLEKHYYHSKILTTEIEVPPVFILGHWRNGTTFLHNLLCRDARFSYARAYQSVFPGSFLLRFIPEMINRTYHLVPIDTRPMDNVKFSLIEPWEDEFIMAVNTGISPYIRAMFPKTLGPDAGYSYPGFHDSTEVDVWKKAFLYMMKRLTIVENKPMILKSPPHTARIDILLELFPKAKFIHIIRNPYSVFPSNIKLWNKAFSLAFLQKIQPRDIIEIVLSTYEHLYQTYHAQRDHIPDTNFIEIKFEELEKDPVSRVREIYDHLQFPYTAKFHASLTGYLSTLSHYKKNRFDLSDDYKKIIRSRWSDTFERYGYQ